MSRVIGSLVFLTILLCNCVTSNEFLRVELNDRFEQRYNNNPADVPLYIDQENTEQPTRKHDGSSNHDGLNVIPTDLSERAFHKYYQLHQKFKLRKLDGDDKQVVPVTSTYVPTTTQTATTPITTTTERETKLATAKTTEEIATTTPLCKQHEFGHDEEYPELSTDIASYDFILFVDKQQLENESILAPSGVGLFHGIVNFVRWLLSLSVELEVEDYEE